MSNREVVKKGYVPPDAPQKPMKMPDGPVKPPVESGYVPPPPPPPPAPAPPKK